MSCHAAIGRRCDSGFVGRVGWALSVARSRVVLEKVERGPWARPTPPTIVPTGTGVIPLAAQGTTDQGATLTIR